MAPPRTPTNNRRPFLFLLRRDLCDLYGPEDSPPDPSKLRAPLLVGFGILSGLDLLAKMWTGKRDTIAADTQAFLETICRLEPGLAAALVQFRHSAGHGYRLGTNRYKDGQRFDFTLSVDTTKAADAIMETSPFNFTIHLWSLKKLFLQAVNDYRAQVEADFELQQKFTVCLANLGECQILRSAVQAV